jgi:hypothetical protein
MVCSPEHNGYRQLAKTGPFAVTGRGTGLASTAISFF